MFYQPSRARVRTLVHALCIAPAVFSAPLHAQETPDVQTQLKQIQASLNQIRSEYEQRIATLENQVSQLQKENTQLSARVTTPAKASSLPLAQVRQEPPAKTTTAAQQRVAKAESVEEAITAVAPPPAAAAPTPFPNLSGKDRTIDLGAELFLDAKYASQSQNPQNAYAGTLPNGAEGVPRGFSIGETELVFKGAVDNLFRGEARFVLEQEGNSTAIKTEELFAETLGLPWGTKIKAGKYWSNVGYLNDKHPHEWDFVDLPLVYKQVFGGQLNETGAQLSWIAPTDNMLFKLGGEIAQGSNGYTGTYNSNFNQNKPRLGTLFAKTGGDIGDSHSWQGGVSWVRATTGNNTANQATYTLTNTNPADASNPSQQLNFTGGNTTWIADFVYRWAPFGNPTAQNLKIQGEMFWNKQSGSMASNYNCSDNDQCLQGTNFAQNQQGFYTQGIYQFIPKWRVGYRYDRVFNGTNSYGLPSAALTGSLIQSGWDPYRNTLMMDWANSEYSLIRLQLARDNAFGPGLYNNAIYLQYIMSLGAHGSHKY